MCQDAPRKCKPLKSHVLTAIDSICVFPTHPTSMAQSASSIDGSDNTADQGRLFLQSIISAYDAAGDSHCFDTSVLSGITNIVTTRGRCRCSLSVTPSLQNPYGTLHGGCIGSILFLHFLLLVALKRKLPRLSFPCHATFTYNMRCVALTTRAMPSNAATLVDTIGTVPFVTLGGPPGVSINLAVTYLAPAATGETVDIDARCVKAGRSIGTVQVEIKERRSGRLVASGTHVKYLQRGGAAAAAAAAGGGGGSRPAQPRARL